MSRRAVFLSYAIQDAVAADRICSALRAAGVEVWFDKTELRGGDTWDAKIRQQIRACSLFIPLISINTRARGEGYFRLEWKLAIDRSHLMAGDQPFLLPVVLDSTREAEARVPDRFLEYQWIRLEAESAIGALVEHVRELLTTTNPDLQDQVGSHAVQAAQIPGEAAVRSSRFGTRDWRAIARATAVGGIVAVGALSCWYFAKPAVIEPYSRQDRRMTAAFLPLTAPEADAQAKAIATASSEVIQHELKLNKYWIHVATRAQVDSAMAKTTSPRALASDLDVHFLIRGSVARSSADYQINLYTIDGDTERTLGNESLKVAADSTLPQWIDDVDGVEGMLVYRALQQEVRNAASKPLDQMDVRDLTFRAFVQWGDHQGSEGKEGYNRASALLKRALALAPDDLLALKVTAEVNLCDCVEAWSKNPEEQRAIGAAAVERFLRLDRDNPGMLLRKANLFELADRWEEVLDIADTVLRSEPDSVEALANKAQALLRLGRAQEALPIADGLMTREQERFVEYVAFDADVHFALGDYETAARLSRLAASRYTDEELRNRKSGGVRLTLAAAEAELGHKDRAVQAVADFQQLVPNANSISAIKMWMAPNCDLAGFAPLFAALRLAGVPD